MKTDLIGVSQSMDKIRSLIEHVADTGLNCVISGESGVGKEVVARVLYQGSAGNNRPFVKINCAAIPAGLMESELFGYEAGAFTGAAQRKRGKFELASGGILFLDEIGDMPLELQAKLLHACQSGEYAPLGSEIYLKTDAWIVAATNKELAREVKNGTFRKDLYYRLNIVNIHIPPLRERPEDIPPLIDYYLDRYAGQFSLNPAIKPNSRVMQKLMAYHWPGNVRELQNLLKRSLAFGDWERVLKEHMNDFPAPVHWEPVKPAAKPSLNVAALLHLKGSKPPELASLSLKKIKQRAAGRIEREVIAYVLEQTNWNRTKAVKILNISYKTLLSKISALEIKPQPERFSV